MRVLASGLTTAATTVAGGSVVGSVAGEAVGVDANASQRIAGVFLSWASSAASTVAIKFQYGRSSAGYTVIPLAIPDSSASNNVYVPLGITASQWDVLVPTTMAKGLVAIVYAD